MLTPGKKLKEFIVYEHVWTKTSFGFSKFASISPKQLPQNQDCNRKNEKLEKWGSKMALILPSHGTCEKNERGFCSSVRYEQKPLFRFFKIHLRFPVIAFGNDMLNWSKTLRKQFLLGKGGISDPPEVVSGFRGGGGGSLDCGATKCPGGF
jgi:hypothetical protein